MPSLLQSFKLLADPTRIRLLLILEQSELTVAEIQEILGMGQSRISTHLSLLRKAGLVQDRRAGKNIYYGWPSAVSSSRSGIAERGWQSRLREIVRASAEEITEATSDQRSLGLVLRKREDKARDYFNRLAGKFGRQYCPGRSWDSLAHMLLGLMPPMVIADLGAGEGMLSQLLARSAKQVIAVDNSEKMVEYGTQMAREHGFSNLEYRFGDIQNPPITPASVDLVLLSQALHHAASPEKAIAAAFQILKPGGRIMILDLLNHNFEQARELYADVWLGFSTSELHQILEQAGFKKVAVEVVSRETQSPFLQTILGCGVK